MRGYVLLSPSSGSLVKSHRYQAWKSRKATYKAAGASNVEGVRPKPLFLIPWDLLKRAIVANCMAGLGVTHFEAQRRGNKGIEKLVQLGQLGPDNFKG